MAQLPKAVIWRGTQTQFDDFIPKVFLFHLFLPLSLAKFAEEKRKPFEIERSRSRNMMRLIYLILTSIKKIRLNCCVNLFIELLVRHTPPSRSIRVQFLFRILLEEPNFQA